MEPLEVKDNEDVPTIKLFDDRLEKSELKPQDPPPKKQFQELARVPDSTQPTDKKEEASGPVSHWLDYTKLSLFLLITVIVYSLFSVLSIFVVINNVNIWTLDGYYWFISFLIVVVHTLDLGNIFRLYVKFKYHCHSTKLDSLNLFKHIAFSQSPLPPMLRKFLWINAGFLLLSVVPNGFIMRYYLTQFKVQIIPFVLVNIGISLITGLFTLLTYLFFKRIESKAFKSGTAEVEEFQLIFNLKKLVLLSIFRTLPLCELTCSFIGESIVEYLPDKRLIYLFCFIYPLLMGFWQKLLSITNERGHLDLDFIGESYSLLFAVIPYKLVYIGLEEMYLMIILLSIKLFYKLMAYAVIPLWSLYCGSNKISKVEDKPKNEATKNIQLKKIDLELRSQRSLNRSEIDKEKSPNDTERVKAEPSVKFRSFNDLGPKIKMPPKITSSASDDKKLLEIKNEEEIDKASHQIEENQSEHKMMGAEVIMKMERRRDRTKSITARLAAFSVKRFFDDPNKNRNEFIQKFMFIQNSEILINFIMMALVLIDKYIISSSKITDKSLDLSTSLILSLTLVSGIELFLDLALYICCGLMLKKIMFAWNYEFTGHLRNFVKNVLSHLIFALLVLLTMCFYIIYNIILVK